MNDRKFATAINCMDGRVQMPVTEWVKNEHRVDYVDMITEPGPNKILAEMKDTIVLESIRRKVEISVSKHASRIIVVVGHHDCAGNPAPEDEQLEQIRGAIETVKSWNFDVKVIGLWVDKSWTVHEVG